MAVTASFTCDGQWISEKLTSVLSSLCKMAWGSKWKRAVLFEHPVTFIDGEKVELAMGVGS